MSQQILSFHSYLMVLISLGVSGLLLLSSCDSSQPDQKTPAPPKTPSGQSSNLSPAMKELLSSTSEITQRFYPEENRKGQPIVLRHRGKIFDPPEVLPEISREQWKQSTPLEAFKGWVPAFKSGDAEWIIELFTEEEREDIRKKAENEDLMGKNAQFFAQVDKVAVKRIILYGNYAILFYEHTLKDGKQLSRPITLVEVDQQWYLTNTIGKNPTYSELVNLIMKEAKEIELIK